MKGYEVVKREVFTSDTVMLPDRNDDSNFLKVKLPMNVMKMARGRVVLSRDFTV